MSYFVAGERPQVDGCSNIFKVSDGTIFSTCDVRLDTLIVRHIFSCQ